MWAGTAGLVGLAMYTQPLPANHPSSNKLYRQHLGNTARCFCREAETQLFPSTGRESAKPRWPLLLLILTSVNPVICRFAEAFFSVMVVADHDVIDVSF